MKISDISLLGQYIKDLSFENPMSPNLPSENENPSVKLDINTTYLNLNNDNHEVNLIIKSTTSTDKNIIFVIELQYAGLIKATIKNEEDKKKLIIAASYLLFPYSRSIISNITMEGGFKPLVIQPVEFENMFQK